MTKRPNTFDPLDGWFRASCLFTLIAWCVIAASAAGASVIAVLWLWLEVAP